jgi:hypothetical protein
VCKEQLPAEIRSAYLSQCVSIACDTAPDEWLLCPMLVAALLVASEYGHAKCVEAILAASASVDVADGEGNTPLIVAVRAHAGDCVQLLLSNGAGIDFANDAEMTALDVARDCVEREGSTSELQDIIRYIETAGGVEGHESSEGPQQDSLALRLDAKKWRVAAKTAVAVGRMRRTIVFIVTEQQRHAVEIIGLSQTTVSQFRQKVETAVKIPPEHQELTIKGVRVDAAESTLLSQLGLAGMDEVSVRDRRSIQDTVRSRTLLARGSAPLAGAPVQVQQQPAQFQSAETIALRAQVQQLQQQLSVRRHSLQSFLVRALCRPSSSEHCDMIYETASCPRPGGTRGPGNTHGAAGAPAETSTEG